MLQLLQCSKLELYRVRQGFVTTIKNYDKELRFTRRKSETNNIFLITGKLVFPKLTYRGRLEADIGKLSL